MKRYLFFIITICIAIISISLKAQYIITDDDVVVIDGIIQSCSYNFSVKDIIIPQTLDGQTVTGIADLHAGNGVFAENGIEHITLPSTLKTLGSYAFYGNNISSLDMTNCTLLTKIGNYCFIYNPIANLDLSKCYALQSIGEHAFAFTGLSNLNISSCTSLKNIERNAFYWNSIESLNFFRHNR